MPARRDRFPWYRQHKANQLSKRPRGAEVSSGWPIVGFAGEADAAFDELVIAPMQMIDGLGNCRSRTAPATSDARRGSRKAGR